MQKLLGSMEEFMFYRFPEVEMKFEKGSLERKSEKTGLFIPKQKDKLFWCYYILKYGYNNYHNIDVHPYKIEKKIKMECIDLLKDNKAKIKQRRLKFDVNDLLYVPKISLDLFFSLCLASSINIVLVKDKTYYSLIDNTENEIMMIYWNKREGYGLKKQKETLETIAKTRIESVQPEKHLRAVSAYKVCHLEEFCKKLGINTSSKRMSKMEIYNKIKFTIQEN